MFPPCVRDAHVGSRASDQVRTVVAKVDAPNAAVMSWFRSSTEAGRDAQAAAIVQLDIDDNSGVFYAVLSLAKLSTLHNVVRDLRLRLESPPINATVAWIRPFDRRLQRLFDWGDVWADRDRLEQLIEDGDTTELTKCLPMLATSIAIGDVQHIPLVASSTTKTPLLCLEDAPRTLGDDEKHGWMRLQHELKCSHCFGESNKNWQCSCCTEFGAARCVCGAQRCHRHQKAVVAPKHRTVWKQSEFASGPFVVQDPKNMLNTSKVEFMSDELAPDASLETFAKLYVQLFGEKICEQKKRASCLELYRLFNPAFKPKKECELSPVQLQLFQKVFNPDAPPRCRWCNAQIPLKLRQIYCNQACAEAANPQVKCQKCGGESFRLVETPGHCKGRINGMSRCNGCGHTEYCQLITGSNWGTKRRSSTAPQHWSKRRRS